MDDANSKPAIDALRLRRARNAWRVMKRRCLDPAFKDFRRYGGAGIAVQETWISSFPQFLADLGLPPTNQHWLGRLNTGGNYAIGNVIWTERNPQTRRRRYCRRVKMNGGSLTIAEAAQLLGIGDMTLRRRLLKQGRPLREAVCTATLARQDSMLLTHLGVTLPLPAWARLMKIDRQRLWARIRQGWPVARALTAPVRPRARRRPTQALHSVTTV